MSFSTRLILGVLMLVPVVVHAANINSVRLWRAPDNTRLVFDLSGSTQHKLVSLPGENGQVQRIVITLPDSRFSADAGKLNLANTPITAFHVEDKNSELQLVIDLKERVKPKSFLLPANNQYGDRLVLDLFDESEVHEVKAVKPASNGMRDILIAVDPGHGGEDPGARGPDGLYEKNVTLAIAKELVKLINDTPGYSAFLTRSSDYYVSLRGRTQIARNRGADLFISIHADAFKDTSAQGAGVFALSQRGATSETARWLAQNENEADLVGGVNLGDKDPVLQEVLLDLSMTATVATSLDMGDKVMGQMKKFAKMHRGFVEQAGFVVLKNPDIPSLLIETGFITNEDEARNLSNPTYRSKMAKGIFSGIDSHFRAKPPMDTALAASRGGKVSQTMDKALDEQIAREDAENDISSDIVRDKKMPARTEVLVRRDDHADKKAVEEADDLEKLVAEKTVKKAVVKKSMGKTVKYVVKKGDTLSNIATKYKVSMSSIQDYNKLSSQEVRIGQTIQIPSASN